MGPGALRIAYAYSYSNRYRNRNSYSYGYSDIHSHGYIHAYATATFTPTATATFTPTPTATATFTPTPTGTPACLVVNGGFETGDFTGWTQSGSLSFTSVNSDLVHSGNFSAELGPTSEGFLDQNIVTVPGQMYTVDFWLAQGLFGGAGPNDFSASFAGVTIVSLTDSGPFPYTHYTMDIMATGTSTDLHFAFFNSPDYWYLDDVCVTPSGGATPTPTPTCHAGRYTRAMDDRGQLPDPDRIIRCGQQWHIRVFRRRLR